MKLKVPLIKQKHKDACGPAAMRMLYKYFGKDVAEERIIKEIKGLTKWGSFVSDLAFMSKKLGFKVICHSYALIYFDPSFAKISRKEFIKRIKSLIRKEKRKYNKRELKSILRVLKSDIDFKMRMPSLDLVRRFLDKKLPVGLVVNSAAFYEKKRNIEYGHFIIVTGYEKDKFYYNDPSDGKSHSISADKLIFSWSNNIFGSSGYLIVIKK